MVAFRDTNNSSKFTTCSLNYTDMQYKFMCNLIAYWDINIKKVHYQCSQMLTINLWHVLMHPKNKYAINIRTIDSLSAGQRKKREAKQ